MKKTNSPIANPTAFLVLSAVLFLAAWSFTGIKPMSGVGVAATSFPTPRALVPPSVPSGCTFIPNHGGRSHCPIQRTAVPVPLVDARAFNGMKPMSRIGVAATSFQPRVPVPPSGTSGSTFIPNHGGVHRPIHRPARPFNGMKSKVTATAVQPPRTPVPPSDPSGCTFIPNQGGGPCPKHV